MKARRVIIHTSILLGLFCLTTPSLSETISLPKDVRAFISRREDCDHFRGEASPDKDRQAQIDREVIRLCKGSDIELERLKRRYSKNNAVLEALDIFDPDFESGSSAIDP
ncbi:hypothetical protein [Rhizobium sp. No.120]